MNIVSFILGLIGPLVVRGVLSLGATAIVFTGTEQAVNALVTYAQNSWSVLPLDVLEIASLSGVPDALGMIFGALVSIFAVQASIGFSRYVFKPK